MIVSVLLQFSLVCLCCSPPACLPAEDTHLHALLQRLLEQLEVDIAFNKRQLAPDRIPKLSRQEILDLVANVWQQIDHQKVAKQGYVQTGPLLPLVNTADGGVIPEVNAIFKDLKPFTDKLDLQAMCSAAIREVNEHWEEGVVTQWSDAGQVIEQHTGHSCIVEGTEGWGWDVDEEEHCGDGPDEVDNVVVGGDAPEEADDEAVGPDDSKVSFAGICEDPKYIAALETVSEAARLTRDDVLLKMLTQRRAQSIKKAEATSCDTAKDLRRRAEADQAAMHHKRLEVRELERRAALEEVGAKKALEDAKAKAAEERRKELEASRLDRLEQEQHRAKAAKLLQDAEWLQVKFPAAMAERLLAWRRSLSREAACALRDRVEFLVAFGRCTTSAACPYLWDEDKRWTSALGGVTGPDRARHTVRCSKTFEWLLYNGTWAGGVPQDAAYMLGSLLDRVLPNGKQLFRSRYTVQVLLHDNQYVVEKAFINAVFLMYRWLGPHWLPGQWNWPPQREDFP